MRAGRLRHTITIQSATRGQGSMGGAQEIWSEVLTCRAAIIQQSGSQAMHGDVQANLRTVRFQIRHPGIEIMPNMQVVMGTRQFDIEAVIDLHGAGKTLELVTTEAIDQ